MSRFQNINGSLVPIAGYQRLDFDTVPTLGSINPVTSNGIASNIDSITTNINTVELTTTAANAHSVGEYFILIGQFVKCTQAISVGDMIAIGTNVEATSIGAVLGQLNSKLGNTDISSIGNTVTEAISNLDRPKLLASIPANTYSNYGAAFGSLLSYFNALSFAEKTNTAVVMKDSSGNNATYFHTAGTGYGFSTMSYVPDDKWQILQKTLSLQWADFYKVTVTGYSGGTPIIECTIEHSKSQDDAIYYYLF